MRRSDFVSRGERKVDFLKYYRLVTTWARKEHNLNTADLELLFYLDPLKYFTIDDFKDGTLYYTWDKTRFYRLIKQGWMEKIHSGSGRVGGHSKYVVSSQGKRLINRIYRILIDQEEIPMSAKRNGIMKGMSYADKVLKQALLKKRKKL